MHNYRRDYLLVCGMSQSDAPVYSTKQVADSLGLGAAMVRKYAVALEKLTGEDIPLKRRDGRQFSLEHFQTISKAKALVDSNNGLNIETALRMALGDAQQPVAPLAAPRASGNSPELVDALSAAVARGNEPLLKELQELRLELRELRLIEPETAAQIKQLDELQAAAQRKADASSRHGPLVRAAMWVERLMRGDSR